MCKEIEKGFFFFFFLNKAIAMESLSISLDVPNLEGWIDRQMEMLHLYIILCPSLRPVT